MNYTDPDRSQRSARTGWALLALLLGSCGAMPGMRAGVTTGGAQDLGLVRNHVAAGRIPHPEAFTVEGLLSEHDIAITGPACARRFCIDAATGVAPALDTGGVEAFMVLGLSSSIDLRAFRRPPLDLVVVVDRSGSMGGGKISAARAALGKMADTLRPDDALGVVIFDDRVDVLREVAPVGEERGAIRDLAQTIEARGSTDIESALAVAFQMVERRHREGAMARVMLLTDARPNTGRVGQRDFLSLSQHYAQRGIGLTVFGVGLDFGQSLTLAISRLPGGSYHYLENEKKLATVFDRDFDLLVTPVAWDLELDVRPAEGYRIVGAYGVPSWVKPDAQGTLRVHIPTLFLSRNRGALVFRLRPLEDGPARGPIATTALRWRERPGAEYRGGRGVATAPDGPAPTYQQPGVRTAVALVNVALGLREASRLARGGQGSEALAMLDRLDAVIQDVQLPAEARLSADLRRLIETHVRSNPEPREPLAGDRRDDGQWIR